MAELAMTSPEIEVTLDGNKINLNQIADDISVYNMQGMLIAHHRGVDSVLMSDAHSGIYIIKVVSGGKSVVKKVKF